MVTVSANDEVDLVLKVIDLVRQATLAVRISDNRDEITITLPIKYKGRNIFIFFGD
jgi:hypothetical protein